MKKEELNNELFNFAETILDDNHSLSFRMQGNSMYPTLKPNDVGIVEKCTPENLRIGDIVIIKETNKLIAHRLIDIVINNNIRIFITKGDNNYYKDTPFTCETLVGVLSSFQRNKNIRNSDSFIMKIQRFLSLHFPKLRITFYHFIHRQKNKLKKNNSDFQSIKQNFSLITRDSGKNLFINIIISCLQGILPFVIVIFIKVIIDLLTHPKVLEDNHRFLFVLLLIFTALVFLSNGVLSEVKGFFSEKLSHSVTCSIYSMLHNKHNSLDLSYYENPVEQDKIHRAVKEASYRPIKIINELLAIVRSLAAMLFMSAMFVTIRWYLLVLLLIAIIPGVLVRKKYSEKLYKLKESQSTKEREMYYFNRILTGFPFVKELKLFGFYNYFLKRFSKTQDDLFKQKISLQKSELRYSISADFVAIILVFIPLGYIFFLKLNGKVSIGTLVMFLFAFQRGYSVLNELFRSYTQIREDNTFLNDFIAFLNLKTQLTSKKNEISPFTLKKEIKIENVSFQYESSKREALKSVNIIIPAGKTVAFVGANGSGKTTMVKLICGFYKPNSGKIFFDGVDSMEIGQKTVCENITAVFQDFALYNIPVIENIGLGNIQIDIDLEKVKKAVQVVGIEEVIESLPEGYNTLLGSLFAGGEELSIGEWQKMAIVRTLYRDSNLILMDEPSSALDADSELKIIGSLKKIVHDKTAVIISHRLSTVQWADLIYFFDKGEVLESGSHQELIALQGKYYSLFQSVNRRE